MDDRMDDRTVSGLLGQLMTAQATPDAKTNHMVETAGSVWRSGRLARQAPGSELWAVRSWLAMRFELVSEDFERIRWTLPPMYVPCKEQTDGCADQSA